ncbi:DUF305 domain-containing protein [Mycolicibacterium flavescens]|uniref:DUF305 domain-containing protein n=1 Tax=Mycolicibacterium flavescens TaxID=1776 RepID=A0A1E3RN60_MYCFV|nr:DUF305 domain-containing protein [Mycolicibacterium flavescens]MCV7281401.1 DUF305 domain-containing protein [Mycolicibacterium flavescens]ODQ91291.1 DUF305 domain-containing protein [Mycolicibacterium flavescens]
MQHKRFGFGFAALAASTLFISACSNATTESQSSTSSTSAAASASPSAASSDATHNDADVKFAQGMIPHHQQAIEMSDMLLGKQGIDPEVISLANDIKNAQGPEIEKMQGWLQEWGVPSSPAPAPTSAAMPGHNMPGHQMPSGDMGDMPGMGGGHGMMSEADMAALQNAQGAEATRLFLSQMITHHKGAIMMAQEEIEIGQFPAAVEMARAIVSSQQAEIDMMQGMLDK